MVNKILIDTNVLLDYLLEREPFFEDSNRYKIGGRLYERTQTR